MKSTHRPWPVLTAVIVAANGILLQRLPAQQASTKPVAGNLEKRSYSIKSTYATVENCNHVTGGIFIVWWDKAYD